MARDIIKRNKQNIRDVVSIEKNNKISRMFELRRMGYSYEEIGNDMGYSKGWVYKVMKKEREQAQQTKAMTVFQEQDALVSELLDDLVDINLNIERLNKMKEYDEDGNELPVMNTSLYEQKRKHIESMAKILCLDKRAGKELEKTSTDGLFKLVNLFSSDVDVNKEENDRENPSESSNNPDPENTGNSIKDISKSVIARIKDQAGFSSISNINDQIKKVYEYEKVRDEKKKELDNE